MKRLQRLQEILDLEARLEAASAPPPEVDLKSVEEAFVEVAREYSAKHGISYRAWRAAGVSTDVLRTAGLMRTQKLEPAESE